MQYFCPCDTSYVKWNLHLTCFSQVIIKKWLHCCLYLPENWCTVLHLDDKVASILICHVFYTSQIFIHNGGIEFTVVKRDNITAHFLLFPAHLQHDQASQLHCRLCLVFFRGCVVVESWLFLFETMYVSDGRQLICQSEEGKSKCLSATSVFGVWLFRQPLLFSVFWYFQSA